MAQATSGSARTLTMAADNNRPPLTASIDYQYRQLQAEHPLRLFILKGSEHIHFRRSFIHFAYLFFTLKDIPLQLAPQEKPFATIFFFTNFYVNLPNFIISLHRLLKAHN